MHLHNRYYPSQDTSKRTSNLVYISGEVSRGLHRSSNLVQPLGPTAGYNYRYRSAHASPPRPAELPWYSLTATYLWANTIFSSYDKPYHRHTVAPIGIVVDMSSEIPCSSSFVCIVTVPFSGKSFRGTSASLFTTRTKQDNGDPQDSTAPVGKASTARRAAQVIFC